MIDYIEVTGDYAIFDLTPYTVVPYAAIVLNSQCQYHYYKMPCIWILKYLVKLYHIML